MKRALQEGGLETFAKYHVVAKLADGAKGLVYKASDPSTGATVAIKVGSIALARDKVLLKRFEQEFTCTSNLSHPNIVRALEFGWENSRPYIVMEFVDGEDLGARIRRQGRLGESEAVDFIVQVALGLHEAHKNGIIHRDIKPDNILLTADGQAKLADLGLSKDLEANLELTCDYRSLGTDTFVAPEQIGDAKRAGVRSDIYSLGATLYTALTGQVPFPEPFLATILKKKLANNFAAPRQLVPALTEQVDRTIRRAMLADHQQRFASCPEFVAALKGEEKRSGLYPIGQRKTPARKPKFKAVRPPNERRGGVRYECALTTTCTVDMSVHPDFTELGTPWETKVCDLSVTGIGLLLERRFEPGCILTVKLASKDGDFEKTCNIRVLHVSPADRNGWFIGGALVEKLTREELRQLL